MGVQDFMVPIIHNDPRNLFSGGCRMHSDPRKCVPATCESHNDPGKCVPATCESHNDPGNQLSGHCRNFLYQFPLITQPDSLYISISVHFDCRHLQNFYI